MMNKVIIFLMTVMGLSFVANSQTEINIEMVFVQGGTFIMGCTDEQGDDCKSNEKPTQEVTLSDYYISKYEVTQAQWKSVMGEDNNPSLYKGDSLVVENVSWKDVQIFIRKLNQKTGKNYHLPTEAEWEYAARGGNKSKGYKYSGSNEADSVAWYYETADYETHPVGTKQCNELGIYDMSGNVYEWCNDWYGKYSNSPQTNPKGLSSGFERVVRGGSWYSIAWELRVSYRGTSPPDLFDYDIGFRLAHNIE